MGEASLAEARRAPRSLVGALVLTAVVWLPLFIVRVQAHQANVDDFLYAKVAHGLASSLSGLIRGVLNSGQTSPLVPTLAAPGAAVGGVYGAMAIELPLLLVLVAGAYVMARIWLQPTAAAVTAVVVGCNHAVMSYALMLNFAVASSAAVVWCLASYLHSDHLREWRWSLAFGVSTAVLLLSRSLAPVYAVPLALVVMVDVALDVRKRRRRDWRPALAAVGLAAVLAGPWWLFSGSQAVHYLLHAGYQPSSGYVTRGAQLTPSSVLQRVKWSLDDLGWFQSWVLAAGLVSAVVIAFIRPDLRRQPGLALVLGWTVLTVAILSSSANQGTGFGLPVEAVAIILVASFVGNVRKVRSVATGTGITWGGSVLVVLLIGVSAVGVAATASSSGNPWWPAAPFRLEVLQAGGTARTNVDALTAQVARSVGSSRALDARQDDILNLNGLTWEAASKGRSVHYDGAKGGTMTTGSLIGALPSSTVLITGTSPDPYLVVDQAAIEAAALRDGYRPVAGWKPGARNTIIVWKRGG